MLMKWYIAVTIFLCHNIILYKANDFTVAARNAREYVRKVTHFFTLNKAQFVKRFYCRVICTVYHLHEA